MRVVRYSIYWLAVIFLIVSIAGVMVIFLFSLEFKNSADAKRVFDYMVFLIPVAIVMTLAGKTTKKRTTDSGGSGAGSTIGVAIAVLVVLGMLRMFSSFGAWVDETILYRHSRDHNITINRQIYDVGAMGYDRDKTRLVEIKPFFHYFNRVTDADIVHLDKSLWILVDEPGRASYP